MAQEMSGWPSQNPILAHEFLEPLQATLRPPPVAIFLHGIMGRRKNLLGFVKKLHDGVPHFRFLLVDLRNHGDSQGFFPPHTLENCALDIDALCRSLSVVPEVVVGHSFGGKVALEYARLFVHLKKVWVLDADPGATSPHALEEGQSTTALSLLKVLSEIAWPISSRRVLIELLSERSISKSVAAWMTTNLRPAPQGGYVLCFELDSIRHMLKSFLQADYWPVLEKIANETHFYFVAADRGGRLLGAAADRLVGLGPLGHVTFSVLHNAGHFLHIDQPDELCKLMWPFLYAL